MENKNIVSDKKEIAEVFNSFFSNAVQSLGILTDNMGFLRNDEDYLDPILGAINKYNDHPSIKKIKQATLSTSHFSFSQTQKQWNQRYYL